MSFGPEDKHFCCPVPFRRAVHGYRIYACGDGWWPPVLACEVASPVPAAAEVRGMPFLDINGGPIHYDSVGEGPTLLYIAGTGFSGKTWWPASIERMARRFRVITWDLRG